MIPDRVIKALEGPAFLQVATRDRTLMPMHVIAVGGVVHDDRQTVTVFVPTARAERMLPNLLDNGRVALGIGMASHEAYQIKGTFVASRPTDDADRARQETYRAALFASALDAGYPEAIARPFTLGFAYVPGTAITFRAEEIYLQTPGPDAGARLSE
jgi:hypothetical protein